MKLTTSELVYINEAAKALKQKDFIIIDNFMIGLDNIQNIVTYLLLDSNFINNYNNGIIINQRALSAFIKTLSIESDFEFNPINTGLDIIRTISGGELTIRHNQYMAELACSKFKYAISLDENIQVVLHETEIPDILSQVQNMKSDDGAIGINYNGYYMTLFPALIPSNKSDKLYIKIMQPPVMHTFISKFYIIKKKFSVVTYVNFIKV